MSSKFFKRLGYIAVPTASYFTYDHYFQYERVWRSLRTIHVAFMTYIDFKLYWDEEKSHEIHKRIAPRWFKLCVDNGGLYIKLGQSIAMMNSVLPKEYQDLFGSLHDQAPSIPYDDVKIIVEKEFGKKINEVYANFEPNAIASASIAQVHKAELLDGTQVAVKVQKPNIQAQLPFDLGCYRLIVYLYEKAFDLPIYWTTDAVCNAIMKEADFINEAHYTELADKLLEKDRTKKVYVPKLYWSHIKKGINYGIY